MGFNSGFKGLNFKFGVKFKSRSLTSSKGTLSWPVAMMAQGQLWCWQTPFTYLPFFGGGGFWYIVASCWIFLCELYYDARIHEHQLPILLEINSGMIIQSVYCWANFYLFQIKLTILKLKLICMKYKHSICTVQRSVLPLEKNKPSILYKKTMVCLLSEPYKTQNAVILVLNLAVHIKTTNS